MMSSSSFFLCFRNFSMFPVTQLLTNSSKREELIFFCWPLCAAIRDTARLYTSNFSQTSMMILLSAASPFPSHIGQRVNQIIVSIAHINKELVQQFLSSMNLARPIKLSHTRLLFLMRLAEEKARDSLAERKRELCFSFKRRKAWKYSTATTESLSSKDSAFCTATGGPGLISSFNKFSYSYLIQGDVVRKSKSEFYNFFSC